MSVERKIIMLVDDNATNLEVGRNTLESLYRVYPIPSGDIFLDLLEHVLPDLVLLDIEMPGMNGYEVIAALKKKPKWKEIPVIFLTARADEGSELKGLSLGAIDYVSKPFSAPLLLKRIENNLQIVEHKKQLQDFNASLENMVAQKTFQVVKLQNSIMNTVADLIEFRDYTTGSHIFRTQKYLKLLLEKTLEEGIYTEELFSWNLEHFISSSPLHDLGKLAISDSILNKPGKLTPEEFEAMKKHVEIGVRAIRKIEENMGGELGGNSFLRHARLIAGGHHEKWDGSGYPLGLQGTDIPLEGRLMAIADVYDALTSVRPYRRPMPTDKARKMIESGSGTHFDPSLAHIFSKVADMFAAVARSESYN
ncbi:MAG: response regulator [Cystobacterineae bacterium]|nr:response regulator [Cystobacterineae bacterium]